MMNDMPPAAGGAPDGEAGASPDLRQRLRRETRERHERLDARFEGMHAADSPDAYRRFIRVNAACHSLIEPILGASPLVAAVPDWTRRDRSAHLAADMAAMRLAHIVSAPFAFPAPDLAEAIGIAYVLEGSRLGARYIHRLVCARAPSAAWAGASLHYLESAEEPDRFRDFMQRAADLLGSAGEIDRAVAAANACFDTFLETERMQRSSSSLCSISG